MNQPHSPARWVAAALLLVTAGAHVPLVREHLEEAPYIGWGFIVLIVASVGLAVGIALTDDVRAWMLGAGVCLVALVAFLVSRTVGLPQIGDDVGNWTEAMGFPAVTAEVLMVVLSLTELRHRRTAQVASNSVA
jgi:hypothetical protein